jgi:transcriptional regulator with XRE-family HTH domain
MSNVIALKLDEIQNRADINGKEVAQLLGTTPETVSRWRVGKAEPQPRTRDNLLQLDWLVAELSELYLPKEAHLWLFSHHKQLAGARPVDLIQRGEIDEVLVIISQLKDGAYP